MKKLAVLITLLVLSGMTVFAVVSVRHNWLCEKCSTLVMSESTPNTLNCPSANFHKWHDLGKVGSNTYQCSRCGVTVQVDQQPTTLGCPKASFHKWTKLNR